MSRCRLTVGATFVVWVGLLAPCLGASWTGQLVLPNSGSIEFFKKPAGEKEGGAMYKIAWPAAVTKNDGQWLRIGDVGGYSQEALVVWVRKKDIAKLDDAQSHYSDNIRTSGKSRSEIAEAHYWRGVYWEAKNEHDAAVADFRAAIVQGHNSGDLHLRLGRSLSKLAAREARTSPGFAVRTFDRALFHIEKARSVFNSLSISPWPAELYVAWGNVYYERYRTCRRCDECDDAVAAMKKYQYAEQLSTTWYVPPYRQGRLLLEVFEKFLDANQQPDKKTLLAAVQRLTQAVRLDPNRLEPYRERAIALHHLALSEEFPCLDIDCELGELTAALGVRPERLECPELSTPAARRAILDQAYQSVDRALLLGKNREPGSLEIRATIQQSLADTFYGHDDPPLCAVGLNERLNILRSQILLVSAGGAMNEAANRSETTEDIERRLVQAGTALSRAKKYQEYLNDTPACREVFSIVRRQLSSLNQELGEAIVRRHGMTIAMGEDYPLSERHDAAIDDAEEQARLAYNALHRAESEPTAGTLSDVADAIALLGDRLTQVHRLQGAVQSLLVASDPDAPEEAADMPPPTTQPVESRAWLPEFRALLQPQSQALPLHTPLNLSN